MSSKTINDEFLSSSKTTTNKHRKLNPTTINFSSSTPTTTPTTTSSSSTQESLVVIVHLDFHFRSKLLNNFYTFISKFKLNSNIINTNNISLLNEIIYHTKHQSIQSIQSPPQLLYRGSRDGFKAIDFHSLCDLKGPTLTLIKSASEPFNQIFGGFTTQSWESRTLGDWVSDDSAFIFKIVDNNEQSNQQQQLFRKFNIQHNQTHNAICVHPNHLTLFGGGCDIFICSDCNLNSDSNSYFGHTYELPTNSDDKLPFKYGSEKARNYLAGSEYFKVSEIEVFKIITTKSIQ